MALPPTPFTAHQSHLLSSLGFLPQEPNLHITSTPPEGACEVVLKTEAVDFTVQGLTQVQGSPTHHLMEVQAPGSLVLLPRLQEEGDSQAMEAVSLIALMQMAAALRDTKVATEALVAVFEGGVASEEALVIEGVSVIEEALPMIIMEDISTAAEVEVVQEVRWAPGDLGVGPEEGVGELGDSQWGSVVGDNIQGHFLLVLSALFRQSPSSYKVKPVTRNVEQGK